MNVTFFASAKDREDTIAAAFKAGVERHGDRCEVVRPAFFPAPNAKTDVAVMIGVAGYSRSLMEDHLAAGKHVVYIDKGYLGRGTYWRVSIDSFQPHAYFQRMSCPDDRLRELGITLSPMRKSGEHIILAGGSVKYAKWHGMKEWEGHDPMTSWALRTLRRLRKYSTRPVIYRPKPSWRDALPIDGAGFSRPPELLRDILPEAWALVTFGSNAAVEALIAGVPVLVLGDGIAKPLAREMYEDIENPFYPRDAQRWQWLSNVAYCQFTQSEMRTGLAWDILHERCIGKAPRP